MKVASNAFKLNYISVDDKVSNKKELFEKIIIKKYLMK